jgi:hypothetical protein
MGSLSSDYGIYACAAPCAAGSGAEQAQALLECAKELRRRSIEVHDLAHGSALERERDRLLATGNNGARH